MAEDRNISEEGDFGDVFDGLVAHESADDDSFLVFGDDGSFGNTFGGGGAEDRVYRGDVLNLFVDDEAYIVAVVDVGFNGEFKLHVLAVNLRASIATEEAQGTEVRGAGGGTAEGVDGITCLHGDVFADDNFCFLIVKSQQVRGGEDIDIRVRL